MNTLELPLCRWRGPLSGAHYPCASPKIRAPHGVTADLCRGCALCDHPPPPVKAPTPSPRASHLKGQRHLDCVHAGAPVLNADGTTATKLCPSCRGRVSLKLFGCAVFGEVTYRDCTQCPSYCAKPAPEGA